MYLARLEGIWLIKCTVLPAQSQQIHCSRNMGSQSAGKKLLHGLCQKHNSIEALELQEQPMQLDTVPGGTEVDSGSIGGTNQW